MSITDTNSMELSKQGLEVFKSMREHLTYLKKQQWTITNYLALIYAAILAVKKEIEASPPQRCLLITVTCIACAYGLVALGFIQWDIGNTRKRIGTPTHRASIVYYEHNTLGQRLRQVDNLLKNYFSGEANKWWSVAWKILYDRADDLLPTRNIIVHHPVRRTGMASEGKAIYVYGIYIEPYQRYRNKEHKGLMGKEELKTEDLNLHATDVEALESDLRAFVSTLVEASQNAS